MEIKELEYESLRQEMVNTFERVNKTLVYSLGLYGGFLSYYIGSKTNIQTHYALIFLLSILVLNSELILSYHYNIYKIGTYLIYQYEKPSVKESENTDSEDVQKNKPRWHSMNRGFDEYCKNNPQPKITPDKTMKGFSAPDKSWGSDLILISSLTGFLGIVGVVAVIIENPGFLDLTNFCVQLKHISVIKNIGYFILDIVIVALIVRIIYVIKVMRTYKNERLVELKNYWKKYHQEFRIED